MKEESDMVRADEHERCANIIRLVNRINFREQLFNNIVFVRRVLERRHQTQNPNNRRIPNYQNQRLVPR